MAAGHGKKGQSKRPIKEHFDAMERVEEVARRLRGEKPDDDDDDLIGDTALAQLVTRARSKLDVLVKRRLALRAEIKELDRKMIRLHALVALEADDEADDDDDEI